MSNAEEMTKEELIRWALLIDGYNLLEAYADRVGKKEKDYTVGPIPLKKYIDEKFPTELKKLELGITKIE